MTDVSEFHFIRGRIFAENRYYVTAVREDIEDENQKHTFLFKFLDGEWSRSFLNNRISDFLVFEGEKERSLLLVAEDGEVIIGQQGGVQRGHVDESDDGPSDLRKLVGVTQVSDALLTYGMRRQVYRADLDGLIWSRMDEGSFVSDDDQTIAGFWSLTGPDISSLTAVGLGGAMFFRDGGRWELQELPTNLNLNASYFLASGDTVICGAKGFVAIGRGKSWRVVANDVTDRSFWDVIEFRDKVYLAGGAAGLFAIEDDAVVVQELPLKHSGVSTFDAIDNRLMLLVGDQSVIVTDGVDWTDLNVPIQS